jgi:hypothetical protein
VVGIIIGILLYGYLLCSRPTTTRRSYTLEELIGDEQKVS